MKELKLVYNKVIESEHYWNEGSDRDKLEIYQAFKNYVKEGKILELGCGPGITVGIDLIEADFDYLGVDIADANIQKARSLVENGEQYFVQGDMMSFTKEQEEETFDGVITMFADFHVPRCQRVQLYVNIKKLLKPGGYLLFTCHPSSWEGYIDDYEGARMFWSQFSNRWYDITMRELGFTFVSSFRRERNHRRNKKEVEYFMLFQKPIEQNS